MVYNKKNKWHFLRETDQKSNLKKNLKTMNQFYEKTFHLFNHFKFDYFFDLLINDK